MKGMVFVALENFVSEVLGEDAWETMLDSIELESQGAYSAVVSYPDEELFTIVAYFIKAHNLELPPLLRNFGQFLFPILAEKYPDFVDTSIGLKEFLRSIDGVIHVEVYKLYPDASLPKIDFEELSDGRIRLNYSSKRKLCFFAEGLILGAAKYFNKEVNITHPQCMHEGNESCHIDLAIN